MAWKNIIQNLTTTFIFRPNLILGPEWKIMVDVLSFHFYLLSCQNF